MAKKFLYRSYKTNFQSIPEVMTQMQNLQHELQDTELANLRFFNITYFIITKNVFVKTHQDYFSNKDLLQQLDINFACYYFNALKDYIDGRETTPAWKMTFDFCKENTSMPLIYLALGVNAHVNNDLGLSVFDVVKKVDYKSDFDKVKSCNLRLH